MIYLDKVFLHLLNIQFKGDTCLYTVTFVKILQDAELLVYLAHCAFQHACFDVVTRIGVHQAFKETFLFRIAHHGIGIYSAFAMAMSKALSKPPNSSTSPSSLALLPVHTRPWAILSRSSLLMPRPSEQRVADYVLKDPETCTGAPFQSWQTRCR